MKKVMMMVFAGFLAACSNDRNGSIADGSEPPTDIMVVSVGAERVDCVGVAPMKCLVVDRALFYGNIQGFDFENGYEYKLKIEKAQSYTNDTAPADASLYEYTLLSVLSKEKVEH